jgi:cardiolipin synthase
MSQPTLTVANQLTLLRIALVPALIALVLSHRFGWALAAFVLAGITDLLDGLIARLGRQRTALGAMLDPVADKLLLGSSYVALTWASNLPCSIPAWLTLTILTRDLIIVIAVVLVNLFVGRRVFLPSFLGKLNTAVQLFTAGLVMVSNALGECLGGVDVVFVIAFGVTVISGVHYVWTAGTQPSPQAPAPPVD